MEPDSMDAEPTQPTMASIDEEIERMLEVQRRFVRDVREMLSDNPEASKAVKQLARINEEAQSRPAKRRTRIELMTDFWTVASKIAPWLWQLDMDKLFAYMVGVPILGRALKSQPELWKRKLAFEYPEYWEKYAKRRNDEFQLKAGVLADLRARTRKSQVSHGSSSEVEEVDGFYLLYQAARGLAVHLDRLGLGLAKPVALAEHERLYLEHTLNPEEESALDYAGWAVIEVASDEVYTYFNMAQGQQIVFRPRPSQGESFSYLVRMNRGLAFIYTTDDYWSVDQWLYAEARWRSDPVKITGMRGAILMRVDKHRLILVSVPPMPDGEPGGGRSNLLIPVDGIFEQAEMTGGVVKLKQLRRRYRHGESSPARHSQRQLLSGLVVTSHAEGGQHEVAISHPDFPGLSVPVELGEEYGHGFDVAAVKRSNIEVSYSRPLVFPIALSEKYLTDGRSRRENPEMEFTEYEFVLPADAAALDWTEVLVVSQANLFKYGKTAFALSLDFDPVLEAAPLLFRKYANFLYVWTSPLEIVVFDLFDLYTAAQPDAAHPLVAQGL